jgi:predicted GNAT superfamily acetyltransferase
VCEDDVKYLAQHGERKKDYHDVQGRVFVAYFGRGYDRVRFNNEDATDDSTSGGESAE